jgi:hypothetical protein
MGRWGAIRGHTTCAQPLRRSDNHSPTQPCPAARAVAPPAFSGQRRKPFRLYLCNARAVGDGIWGSLEVLVSKRLVNNRGATLRLLVSGPALSAGRKEHVRRAAGGAAWAGRLAAARRLRGGSQPPSVIATAATSPCQALVLCLNPATRPPHTPAGHPS